MAAPTAYDLTRSAALSSITPERWIALLQLYLSKKSKDEVTPELFKACGAILSLLVSFPSSDVLVQYLETAILSGTIPLPLFVYIFPQLILSSPELRAHPMTWSKLINLTLKLQQSYHPSSATIVAPPPLLDISTPTRNAESIEQVINLLKFSFAASGGIHSPPEQVSQQLLGLLALMLPAISSPLHPRLPPMASSSLIAAVTDLVQLYPLGDTRAGLESWIMDFSLACGSLDLGGTLDEILGSDGSFGIGGGFPAPNPQESTTEKENNNAEFPQIEEDLVAPTAIIRSLLEHRGTKTHGPSATSHVISLLLTTYRSTSVPTASKQGAAAPSISPTVSASGQQRTAVEQTPGVTPGMTPVGGTTAPNRTPVAALPHNHSNTIGRTPNTVAGGGQTPAFNQPPTPLGLAQTPAGRTPANNPRTPGPVNRHARTPTAATKEFKRPGQVRAQLFYEKLLLSVIALVAEEVTKSATRSNTQVVQAEANPVVFPSLGLIHAFTFGKVLPELLATFQDVASACSSSAKANQPSFRGALEGALVTIFNGHSPLLDQCDGNKKKGTLFGVGDQLTEGFMTDSVGDSPMDGKDGNSSPFRRNLLLSLLQRGLISPHFARNLCPGAIPDNDDARRHFRDDSMMMDTSGDLETGLGFDSSIFDLGKLSLEAQDAGLLLQDYCEARLAEASAEDIVGLLDRSVDDYTSHAALSNAVLKRFVHCVQGDLVALSYLSKALHEHPSFLDIMSLWVPVVDLVTEGLAFLEAVDIENERDPQWTYTNVVGPIILLLQSCVYCFGLRRCPFTRDGHRLSADFLFNTSPAHPQTAYTIEERALMRKWHKYVFDANSEGIGDKLLRSTHPKRLLHMAPPLFCEALASKTTDINVLRSGGIAYFMEPLLNWSLAGVLRGIAEDAIKKGHKCQLHLQAIQTIVVEPSCPRVVLQISGRSILRLLNEDTIKLVAQSSGFDVTAVRDAIYNALNLTVNTALSPTPMNPQSTLTQFLKQNYDATAPPSLSPLLYYPPRSTLESAYTSLWSTHKTGGDVYRACRQLSLSLLCLPHPHTPDSPPLVPFFLNSFLPSLLASIDRLALVDQTVCVNAVAGLASWSLLAAFRAERALIDVERVTRQAAMMAPPDVLDADEKAKELIMCHAVANAKILSRRLKSHRGASGMLIHRRLLATPHFASNFLSFASQ
ncbi:mediator complex subunit [Tulasnella sp. 403]|nr:mediator complex subunit [Tulasnella sp. 403]